MFTLEINYFPVLLSVRALIIKQPKRNKRKVVSGSRVTLPENFACKPGLSFNPLARVTLAVGLPYLLVNRADWLKCVFMPIIRIYVPLESIVDTQLLGSKVPSRECSFRIFQRLDLVMHWFLWHSLSIKIIFSFLNQRVNSLQFSFRSNGFISVICSIVAVAWKLHFNDFNFLYFERLNHS